MAVGQSLGAADPEPEKVPMATLGSEGGTQAGHPKHTSALWITVAFLCVVSITEAVVGEE